MRDAGETAPDHDVRLTVHDVGLDGVEHLARVVLAAPGPHEAQPVVRGPAHAGQPVHGEVLALDVLGEHAVVAVPDARGDDVHVVAAAGEARGEALREAGGAVDVGREGVGGDHDRQRTCGHGLSRGVCGGCRGFGHGVRGQSVRRRRAAKHRGALSESTREPPQGCGALRRGQRDHVCSFLSRRTPPSMSDSAQFLSSLLVHLGSAHRTAAPPTLE